MNKGNLMENIKVEAYKYAEANAANKEEKQDLFYSVIQEAINHVKSKKAVAN